MLRGTVGVVRWVETALKNTEWFVLLHDGSKISGPTQAEESPAFFTRVYRMRLDGEDLNTWVKFVYDLRQGANRADFYLSTRDPNGVKPIARERAGRKLLSSLGATLGEEEPIIKEGAKQ